MLSRRSFFSALALGPAAALVRPEPSKRIYGTCNWCKTPFIGPNEGWVTSKFPGAFHQRCLKAADHGTYADREHLKRLNAEMRHMARKRMIWTTDPDAVLNPPGSDYPFDPEDFR